MPPGRDPEGGGVSIRTMVPDDATSLVECFVRCYGTTYPNAELYDAEDLAARVLDGRLCSVVAIDADGRVVGHTGLSIRHPEARATEAGNTVVDPTLRGQGLLGRLGAALSEVAIGRGDCGYVHYPTGAHHVMQKASVARGGVETGIMVAYIPDDTDYVDIDQGVGRLAATIVYQPFAPAPHRRVHVPEPYGDLLAGLYERADLDRELASPHEPPRLASTTAVGWSYNQRRSLARAEVTTIGADISTALASRPIDPEPAVEHVDLPLADPAVGYAVAAARELGYVYCGLLPEFWASDVLRLQRVASPRPTDPASLVTAEARDLLAFIETETEEAGGRPVN